MYITGRVTYLSTNWIINVIIDRSVFSNNGKGWFDDKFYPLASVSTSI